MAGGGEGPDKDQKTEEASPQRLQKMREDGRVPRSADVTAACAAIGGLTAIAAVGAGAAQRIEAIARRSLSLRDAHAPIQALGAFGEAVALTVAPIAMGAAVAAVIAGVAQTRGLFQLGDAAPKWERLDPLQGIKKVIPSTEVLMELGKTMLKVAVIAYVALRVVRDAYPRLTLLGRTTPELAASETYEVIMRVLVHGGVAFALIAALDFFLSWRKFHEDAKMSKQELKEEHKEQDGDPAVKAKRRARARQLARSRAIGEVKNATVLVTNPTHLAIALRYVPGEDAAPLVLAKGADDIALQMRTEARRLGIPIVENRPLARAMHKTAKIGRPIPVELYEAAAHVIAHVLRLRGALSQASAPAAPTTTPRRPS